jgi:hypothetical protein
VLSTGAADAGPLVVVVEPDDEQATRAVVIARINMIRFNIWTSWGLDDARYVPPLSVLEHDDRSWRGASVVRSRVGMRVAGGSQSTQVAARTTFGPFHARCDASAMSRRLPMHPRAWRRATRFRPRMLRETADPQRATWSPEAVDPDEDPVMLAIQYVTAIVAVLAACLLNLVH